MHYGEGQQRMRCRYEKWCKGDDIEDCTHKQRYEESYESMMTVLQENTSIDDRKFLISCVRARAEQGNTNHPAYGAWKADFMLRQNESRSFLGKYLNDPRVPWRHKRRKMIRGCWGIFCDSSVTLAQWWRARDSTSFSYPQVPGSIPAENTSTRIHMDLRK